MRNGVRLFKVFGIDISLDFSWFIIFFLVTMSLSRGYFPLKYPFFSTGTYWLMGIISSLLLFVTVLMHELSHSLVANHNGLNIRGIKLFVFGGVAQLGREPQSARVEFDVAIAGPICSFALHFIFKGMATGFASINPAGYHSPLVATLGYLAFINAFLAIINLIPAYPLDGGRVLRAFLWSRTGNLRKATAVASGVGKFFALFLIFMGFLEVIKGNFYGLWWVFIGMFLYSAAKMGYEHVLIKDTLAGSLVRDVMTTKVVAVDGDLTLDKVVEDFFFRHHHSSFPVISGNKLKGMLTLIRIKEIPREQWAQSRAADCALPIDPHTIITPRERTENVLARLAEYELGRLLVMDKGKLVGIVTRQDVMKLLKLKMNLG